MRYIQKKRKRYKRVRNISKKENRQQTVKDLQEQENTQSDQTDHTNDEKLLSEDSNSDQTLDISQLSKEEREKESRNLAKKKN